jgi:hypothetical protein
MVILSFIGKKKRSINQETLSSLILVVVSTHRFPPLPPQTRLEELQEVIAIAAKRSRVLFISKIVCFE